MVDINLILSEADKDCLAGFLKSNFPVVFMGKKEESFMFINYAIVLIGADEVLNNIHKHSNPLEKFNSKNLLNTDYMKFKNSVLKKNGGQFFINYFSEFENTIKILNKVKKYIELTDQTQTQLQKIVVCNA